MEYTISVTFLPHLVDMATYAKMCGIDKRGLQKRMKKKRVACVKLDGLILFDTIACPPVKKLPKGYIPPPFVINNEGINLSQLVKVSTFAQKNGITPDRFYRLALLGKLKIIMIMGEAFIDKNDPSVPILMLPSYSRVNDYLPVSS